MPDRARLVLRASLGLARDLSRTLKTPPRPTDATLAIEADGARLARLLERNRTRLVMREMLRKGLDKSGAESEVGSLIGPAVAYGDVADVIEDIVEAYLALRARPDELFVDTVKRLGVEPFRERVYATR